MNINEISKAIKNIYCKLWDVLALYESTKCYNEVPKESDETDIWIYMGNKFLNIRKEISCSFLGDENLTNQLVQIVDETEYFVRNYERPGVVKR